MDNIYMALDRASKLYPLHMPGHKRRKDIIEDFKKFIELDYTEIEDTDNMHKPEGAIKQTLGEIANIYGAKNSYFLINGSSSGVLASILSCVGEDDKILVGRNCHISVYNGILLSGANPVYVFPKIKNNISCAIDLEDIKKEVEKNKDIKACIITSPTYEGLVSNIQDIASFLHDKGILLIVDEAHGSHFKFSPMFPKSALDCGADIVIHSLHKTMPCLTQCAILHINSDRVDRHKLEKCLSMVQTTSPSYIFMLSMEYAINFGQNNKDKFLEYTKFLKEYREELKHLKNIKLLDIDMIDNVNFDLDISRLTFFINSDINGYEINKILRQNNMQLEMYGKNHIIAISTICDNFKELERFKDILFEIDKNINFKEIKQEDFKIGKVEQKINLKKAFNMKKTFCKLEEAIDKICGAFIISYPPGSPILTIGEIIQQEHINYIKECIKNDIDIIGIKDRKICVIDDIKSNII